MINTIQIYFLHRGDNIPFYIGETSKPLKSRLSHHKRKLGKEVLIEQLDIVSLDSWRFWESWYIELFKSWGFSLTNKNKGGGGSDKGVSKHTPESKFKIGESRRGKTLTNETKLKQSKSNTGISRNKGNNFASGYIRSEQSKKNISQNLQKVISQYNLNGEFIQEFSSVNEVKKYLNTKSTVIFQCLKGKRENAYNYIWKYKDK
jgi:hypothetical protein